MTGQKNPLPANMFLILHEIYINSKIMQKKVVKYWAFWYHVN